jgi:internalin A
MKRLIFLPLWYLSISYGYAQTPATEPEKQQVRQLLQTYEKDLQLIGKPSVPIGERNGAKRELLTIIEDKSVMVFNDLDSLNTTKTIPLQKYVQEGFSNHFPAGVNTMLSLDKIQFSPVHYDKVRHYEYLEVRVPKLLTWHTAPATDSNPSDTLARNRKVMLSFFVRFSRGNSMERFKIFAISKMGVPPILPPLPPLIAWWADLEKDWKAVLMKNCKMAEFPREHEIENLLAIRKLSIAKSSIKDASPLAGFTQLVELDCSQTAIDDLSPISDLLQLEDLNVSRTLITDLSDIDSLPNLIRLNCGFLKLKDVRPLTRLTKLEALNLSDNEITDLSPLRGLVQLKKLNFSNNQVTTLAPLSALVNLEELRFTKNKVTDFQVLTQFPNLVVLDCYSTGMDSVEPLKSLPKLVYLSCGANPISTIDPLANHSFLVELNISITKVNNLNALRKFNQLEVLDFSNTMVMELGPVHDIQGLRVLKCQLTKVAVQDKDRFKKKHPGCGITYF